ncbi:MAG TPA: guanylate kinase [Myxococcota bacterium]|nr:guanylate kinase [Myxococcota bacterium]
MGPLQWTVPDRGALFVVSGASGTGKSTLLKSVFEKLPGLEFSVSATTRSPRPGEKDGREYHFVNREAFLKLRSEGALLENAEVYGNFYGTPRAPVIEALEAGRSIVLDIDTQGAAQVRVSMPEAVSIFILPPSIEVIRERLVARAADAPEVIARRVADARMQLAACGCYDYLVVNDDLPTSILALQSIFMAELLRRERRQSWVRSFGGEALG